MRIAILSRNERSYSTERIVESAKKRGHQVEVLDPLRFAVNVEADHPSLLYSGNPVAE